jgi:hypothetical protein
MLPTENSVSAVTAAFDDTMAIPDWPDHADPSG